jgi:hypothetical protein
VNARHALERQWAALIVRQPAARHILLKYLRTFGIPGDQVRFDDPQAALILQAVQSLTYRNLRVTQPDVAAHLAARDFSLSADDAAQFVADLVDALPAEVNVERLALAVIEAQGIQLPTHEVAEHLVDPYGARSEIMLARKVRVQSWP